MTPSDLKALRSEGVLVITWGDGSVARYRFFDLRAACQCAGCVDERTGVRTLDPATIPADIAITDMQLVGSYAARIHWSDGHSTGLYTWNYLHSLPPLTN